MAYTGKNEISIMIRSYAEDFMFLRHCLASIAQYAMGAVDYVLLVVPTEDAVKADELVTAVVPSRFRDRFIVYRTMFQGIHGYNAQQMDKLCADLFFRRFTSPSQPKLIWHLDSDQILLRHIHPKDLAHFCWLRRPYAELDTAMPHGNPWQSVMAPFLGEAPEYEYMRQPFYVLPIELYDITRAYLRMNHSDLVRFANQLPPTSQAFSEYNALGFVATKMGIIAPVREQPHIYYGHSFLHTFWSWGIKQEPDPEAELKRQLNLIQLYNVEVKYLPFGNSYRKVHVVKDDTHFAQWVVQNRRLDYDEGHFSKVQKYVTEQRPMVIEVGANIGTHTTRYVKWTGLANVMAFEPHPQSYVALCNNLGLGDDATMSKANARIYQRAVTEVPSCESRSATLYGSRNIGASALFDREELGAGTFRVRIARLDDYGCPAPVGLLHIDAEGSECLILKGARQTIDQHKPAITIEVNKFCLEKMGSSVDQLFTLIYEMGYFVADYNPRLDQQDVLALPKND